MRGGQAKEPTRPAAETVTRAARRPLEFHFLGFEESEGWPLRGKFYVRDADGHGFWAYAAVAVSGRITDLQASDTEAIGTTARPEIDDMIREYVERALIWMRSAATVAGFDRQHARRLVA